MTIPALGAPIVSVVTPFYNSDDTLDRCIGSVLSQSCADFEYVLADNCSNDRSPDIARYHEQRDSRVRYLRFEDHLPKASNYNRALRMISNVTRYCKIVQADDYLFPECLEQMLAAWLRNHNVGIVGGRRVAGELIDPPSAQIFPEVSSGREICRRYLQGEVYPFGSPTSVMFRADLVRSLRHDFFDGRMYFDDVDVVLNLLRGTDFAFCDEVLTYTQRDATSTFGRVMDYSPHLLNRYVMLRRWGADFFSAEELIHLLDEVAQEYYEDLFRAARRIDRVELFKFHRTVLAGAGFRWELRRICAAMAVVTGSWLVRRGRAILARLS
jgi:glycosyltransferase involved in cell wall biosynthesis